MKTLAVVVAALTLTSSLLAQDSKPIGLWTGKLGPGRVAIEVELGPKQGLAATFYNLDGRVIPFKGTVQPLQAGGYKFHFKGLRMLFEGGVSKSGKALQLELKGGRRSISVSLARTDNVPEVEKRKSFVLPKGMNPTAPMELADFAFLVGEWHGKHSKKIGGGRTAEFLLVWKGKWILNGNAVQNTSQTWILRPDGKKGRMTQDGMDLRVFNSQTGQFEHTYVNAMKGAINRMTWRRVGDEIHSDVSEWQDFEGLNQNIIKFSKVGKDHFTWSVDRSFDQGKTWKKDYVVIENRRVG